MQEALIKLSTLLYSDLSHVMYLVKCTTVNTRSKKKDLNFRFNPKVSSQFTETTLVLCPRFAALFLSLPYFFFSSLHP